MILKWRSFSLFRFSRKLVPKLHKFIDEVFGSLFPAAPINPKITNVEGVILENASLESTVMVTRFNLIFKMLCAIGDVTCALNAGQGRLLRYWRKSSAELTPQALRRSWWF
jgi:hypothetical protein